MLGPSINRATARDRGLEYVRDERGTTLMELLVALAAGVIVTAALFSILDVSLKQSTNLEDRVQANQLGRIAMTRIVDELHSACISPSFTPIQEKSSHNELRFVNAYSNEAVISSAEEHRIIFSSSAKTLTDEVRKSNGGSWPNFTFPSASTSTTRLGSNISELVIKGKTEPIFSYYKYGTESVDSNSPEYPLNTLSETPLTVPSGGLSLEGEEGSKKVASVLIQFNAAAPDGATTTNRSANLSTQVTFAFSVPNSETPVHDSPCQ